MLHVCDVYFRDDSVSLAVGGFLSVDICGIVKWVPKCVAADVWVFVSLVSLMSLSVPNLIVSSALRQYLRQERLMEDAEFGSMLAAALVNWMALGQQRL